MTQVFDALMNSLKEDYENIGLYFRAADIRGTPINEEVSEALAEGKMNQKDALSGGLAEFFLVAEFEVGKVAWSQRVLDPEAFNNKKEFNRLLPANDEEMRLVEIEGILGALKDSDED
jgi:hypothetical protein